MAHCILLLKLSPQAFYFADDFIGVFYSADSAYADRFVTLLPRGVVNLSAVKITTSFYFWKCFATLLYQE